LNQKWLSDNVKQVYVCNMAGESQPKSLMKFEIIRGTDVPITSGHRNSVVLCYKNI
jgi:hypothetical protein